MNVPFVNLTAEYREYKNKYDFILNRTFRKGVFIGGDEVKIFERKFASYINTKHCISMNSGTDALVLATRALELSPNDEIIFPSNTFYATMLAAQQNNLRPVLSECSNDFGYDIGKLKEKINRRTKAIMILHLYGQPDKVGEILSLVRRSKHKIYALEDVCQSHGAMYKGKRVGSFGEFGVFSFYPTKNLGAFGDGGAVTTNNQALARKIRRLKDYGQSKKGHHQSLGTNSRLDTFQAAILNYKLVRLDDWNHQREAIATQYFSLLKDLPEVTLPNVFSDRKSVYHLFVIRVKRREKLQRFLKRRGIITNIHYPIPVHLQKAWNYLGYKRGDFPVAEYLSKEILSLPIYPQLRKSQVLFICNSIKAFYDK